jgi:hypothetical protein
MQHGSDDRIGWQSAAPHAGENNADYRERMALIQAEAVERRRQQLQEQSSPLNPPSDRIRSWERLHQLDLPRNPLHRLVTVIAANTGLSVSDVLAEQALRASAAAVPATVVTDPSA